MNQDITCIIGPTAIGKSAYAINYAKKHNAEIISADAFQIYRSLDIGTAKVLPSEQENIPHHLIDIRNPDETYSVAEFLKETHEIIKNLRKKGKHCVICGGTGLYLKAFLYNYSFPDSKDSTFRIQLQSKADNIGSKALWEELNTIDPEAANKIPYQNTRRTIRALEIIHETGQKASELRQKEQHPRKDTSIIGLTAPRERIIERINLRVDQMVHNGLIKEVEGLLESGYSKSCQAFEGIGYKETIAYLNGSLTKPEMIDLIKIKTRQFSKRQMTWFRQIENVNWYTISV